MRLIFIMQTELESADRWVNCPRCAGPSFYAATNAYRPFCGQKCKLFDLAAWSDENFRLPSESSRQFEEL